MSDIFRLILIYTLAMGNGWAFATSEAKPISHHEILIKSSGSKQPAPMTNKIEDRFIAVSPLEMPAVVPMTSAERVYVLSIIDAMINVLCRKSTLGEKDLVFGVGKYFWPKDPNAPIRTSLTFGTQNFPFRSISVGFRRKDSGSPWTSAGISIHPRNFPSGVYDMKLSQSDFSRFRLHEAFSEKRPDEALREVNVFRYVIKIEDDAFALSFESRVDVSNLNDKFPRTFHDLIIKRLDK